MNRKKNEFYTSEQTNAHCETTHANDQETIATIRAITAKGKDVIVRQARDGTLNVFELNMKKCTAS